MGSSLTGTQHSSNCGVFLAKIGRCTCRAYQDGHNAQAGAGQTNVSQEPPPIQQPAPLRAHGVKLDAGKPPIYRGVLRSFPDALAEVAMVTLEGVSEPGHVWDGWKTVEEGFMRYSDAMGRHLLEEERHKTDDIEERRKLIRTVATTVWNDLARLQILCDDAKE